MRIDDFNDTHPLTAIAPFNAPDNTVINSAIIDMQGYNSLMFAIALGAIVDGSTFAVSMTHGNVANLSDGVAVPTNMLLGTLALAGFTGVDDNKTRKIGYTGDRRYVRLTITPTANTGALIAAMALLAHAEVAPVPNPPV